MKTRYLALFPAVYVVSFWSSPSPAIEPTKPQSTQSTSNPKVKAKPMIRPECITQLSEADRFYGPTPGERGRPNSTQRAYVEATGGVGTLKTEDLNWLLKNGTPAGRIYGAVLLWQTGRVGPNLSYARLTDDGSPVEYQDGCKVMGTSVKEVATSLMENQSFMSFKVGSMFCKLKAPIDHNAVPDSDKDKH